MLEKAIRPTWLENHKQGRKGHEMKLKETGAEYYKAAGFLFYSKGNDRKFLSRAGR